jgi:hypothetical protein
MKKTETRPTDFEEFMAFRFPIHAKPRQSAYFTEKRDFWQNTAVRSDHPMSLKP